MGGAGARYYQGLALRKKKVGSAIKKKKMDDDFYVQLISTDSLGTFKDNSASHFTNILPHQLEFNDDGRWSVAVTKVNYTSSFYNVTKSCGFALFDFDYFWSGKNLYGRMYDCLLPPGYYDDPSILCQLLNDLVDALQIKKLENKKLFVYDKYAKKFSLDVQNLFICMICKGQLIDILGLEMRHYVKYQAAFIGMSKDPEYFVKNGKKLFFKNKEIHWTSDAPGGRAPFVSQMLTINSFLISSNIVRDTIFGSTFSNVMRTCPIDGPQGSRIVKEFSKRMYLPVKASTIQYVTISISDYLGNPIDFLEGNFAVVLHFKRKK